VFCQLKRPTALTALGLTTTLLENGVNRADCKKFLAIYSIATPVCATLAGYFLWFLPSADGGNSDWTGIAMLVSVRCLAKVARSLAELPPSQGRKLPLRSRCPPTSWRRCLHGRHSVDAFCVGYVYPAGHQGNLLGMAPLGPPA
jgi:hypothetical protein